MKKVEITIFAYDDLDETDIDKIIELGSMIANSTQKIESTTFTISDYNEG